MIIPPTQLIKHCFIHIHIIGSGQLLYEDPKPVMNGIEAVYSETTTSHGARGNKILIILCIIPNYKEHGSYFKCIL